MSLLSKQQNMCISENLNPAISRSGDLRLPARFTKLNRQYIEQEFGVSEPVFEPLQSHVVKMNDEAMQPTIANGAMLVVDEHILPKHNDIVIAQYFGETICRRIFMSKRKNWLYGDDNEFKFIDLSKNTEVNILGVVTSHFINHNAA